MIRVKSKLSFLIMTIAIIASTSLGFFQAKPAHASYWRLAYDVKYAFTDSWQIPHYGAFFYGAYGNGYYFSGPSGGPPAPDWWGTNYAVALLSKTWLFAPVCSSIPSVWVMCADRWAPSNHHGSLVY